MKRLRIGISTCPNDTFAFHGLLAGEVATPGLELDFELADVEELNEAMLAGRLDAAKVSYHAALALAEDVRVLSSGSALGFGVGPVVLAPAAPRDAGGAPPLVLCPGRWTTATLLWRLFHPEPARLEQRVFSEILPELAAGRADLGVCIHEARFTWRERGLRLVEDLGARWEEASAAALPLGGIVVRRDLGLEAARRLQAALAASIDRAWADREACLPTMRRHAQEESDEVLWKHVELYVNEHTRALGVEGRRALEELGRLARAAGLVGESAALEVVE